MSKNWKLAGLIAIVAIAIGFGVVKYNSPNASDNPKVYTMQEVLSDSLFTADFNVKEKSLDIRDVNSLKESKSLAISEEDEQELINAMEQWTLTEYNPSESNESMVPTYRLYLTINTGYSLYLSSEQKRLYVMSQDIEASYNIQNGDEFFTLLEKAIQKNTHY
ncbi:hypothetical protein, partial [Lysinibacillus odysseyi]